MKTLTYAVVVVAFVGLSLIGCADNLAVAGSSRRPGRRRAGFPGKMHHYQFHLYS